MKPISMERTIVIAPNWLGDAVMSLPALVALRGAHPDGKLTILARRGVAPMYRVAPIDGAVVELPDPPSLRVPGPRARTAILLPNAFYAALQAVASGARWRVGYSRDGRGWLLNRRIAPPQPGEIGGHESFYYWELLHRAGLIGEPGAAQVVRLQPDPAAVTAWKLKLPHPLVAMHAGASFGTAKRWPPENFAALAGALARRGVTTVLIGAPAERAIAERVRQESGAPASVLNLAGATSLTDVIALLAAADAAVVNDSGPMHLAGAVGTPVVALFGSTNEKETYPLTEPGKLSLLKVPGIECSPCKLRECPIDHPCMTRLTVEQVLAAVARFL